MAELVQEAVNSNSSSESASEGTQEVVSTPPAEGNTAEATLDNRIPKARLDEVIHERNELRERLKAVESASNPTPSMYDAQVKKLMAGGLSKEGAQLILESQLQVARSEKADTESKLHAYEVREWTREIAESFPSDYKEVSAEAEKQFGQLDNEEKMRVVASRHSLQRFFKAARADVLEKRMEGKFAEGAESAYKTKQLKQGMTNMPGKAAEQGKAPLSASAIAGMDSKTYKERLPEINAWLATKPKR